MASETAEAKSAAEAAIRAGLPADALAPLTAAVKAEPSDPKLRVFMAQLLSVLGHWSRAHTQLNVAADLDDAAGPMREMVGHALRCEMLREAVFAGRRSPMVFGQPEPWLALLIDALVTRDDGAPDEQGARTAHALEAAPPSAGTIDGEPFEWIADADSRLGPVIEAMINGRYYWVPFNRLAGVDIEAPTDLRDLVWLPTQLRFRNGGQIIAIVPVRYPGSENSEDGQILMARKTEWREDGADRWLGLGQRVWMTDRGERGLLTIRKIELDAGDG